MFDDLVECSIRGGKECELAVCFGRRVEEVDQGRVVFDEMVEDFMVGRAGEELEDGLVDVFKVRVGTPVVRGVRTVEGWMRVFSRELGFARETGFAGEVWLLW